jgi:hypothetical protein
MTLTHFESLWTGMTQRRKFKDRWCIIPRDLLPKRRMVSAPTFASPPPTFAPFSPIPRRRQVALRENLGLPCASSARQRLKNARQSLCHAFLVEAHGKRHTVAYRTVKLHCRVPSLTMHGEKSLPCVSNSARQRKGDGRLRGQARSRQKVRSCLPCAQFSRTANI